MVYGRAVRSLVVVLAALVTTATSGCVAAPRAISEKTARLAGPRLLVIAPHPDDETLAAGGAITNARRRGWTVRVVVVTCGDGFRSAVRKNRGPQPTGAQMRAYGRARAEECRRATSTLGVPAKDLTFLGFPDGSTDHLLNAGTNVSTYDRYTFYRHPGVARRERGFARALSVCLPAWLRLYGVAAACPTQGTRSNCQADDRALPGSGRQQL